jgi:hypothetical protein
MDYVLAFPQAPVEREIYMNISRGLAIEEGKIDDYILEMYIKTSTVRTRQDEFGISI